MTLLLNDTSSPPTKDGAAAPDVAADTPPKDAPPRSGDAPMPSESSGKPKVAVLDFIAHGIDESKAKALSANLANIVASEVALLGHDVISTADINAMLSYERQKDLLGCEDTSCLAEIGGALGAGLMLSGSLGKMGETFTISLSLVDIKRAQVIQRFQGSAGSEGVLATTVRRGVQVLFGKKQDVAGSGTLFVKTTPPGATVLVDGKEVGLSPVTVDEVPAGDHLIVAKKDNLTGRMNVYLAPEALERVMLKLEGAPPVKLKIFSTPPEAQVFIDGQDVGQTPLVLNSVPSGKHRVRFELEHYITSESTIELSYDVYEAGGRVPLKHEVALKPAPVSLTVAGLLEGAHVAVDGKPIVPPYRVLPGQHDLEVSGYGYNTVNVKIDVAVGEDLNAQVEMVLVPAYATYLDDLDGKQFWSKFLLISGSVLAAGGGALVVWGGLIDNDAAQSHQSYLVSRDVAEIQQHRANTLALSSQAQIVQGVGFGLLGGAAIALGLSIFSFATYPEDPVASVDVSAGVASTSGGAMLLVSGTLGPMP